jgi:hypothetical protein
MVLHRIGARIRAIADQAHYRWGSLLALVGLIQRVLIWLTYQPIRYADTGAYLRLADSLTDLNLSGFDGTRVPGFPLFLVLTGLDEQRTWLAQMALGWAIALLLFWITWRTTRKAALAALVGGLYYFIPGQWLFEANLLSETLTTFTAVLCFAVFVAFVQAKGTGVRIAVVFLLGISAAAVGMVRPYFFPLTLGLLPFVWFAGEGDWRRRLIHLGVYSIGPLLIQGGWLLWIRNTYHMISPTVMSGYSMVQHTGEYFELLPDEVATIRDTYLVFRDAQIAERGVQTNAIWEAIPEMTKASGLTFYELSRELYKLSRQLISENPGLYLRNVVEGWINFWKAPVYWQPSELSPSFIRIVIQGLSLAGRAISVLANAAFLLLSVAVVLFKSVRRRFGIDLIAVTFGGMIWLISIVQTLVDHGDNPRFLVPLQMIVLYVVIRAAYHWLDRREPQEVSVT